MSDAKTPKTPKSDGSEKKKSKPGPAGLKAKAAESAFTTAYLIHEYEKKKGKTVTRFRLNADMLRRNGVAADKQSEFIKEWQAALLKDWDWMAVESGAEFGLIRNDVLKNWVKLGWARFSGLRQTIRESDPAAREEIRAGIKASYVPKVRKAKAAKAATVENDFHEDDMRAA